MPRYTVTRKEAAASLGMSINHFERKVQPDLKVVLSGQLVLIPAGELERWVQRKARRLVSRPVGAARMRATGARGVNPLSLEAPSPGAGSYEVATDARSR